MFQLDCAARCQHAQRIVQAQAHGHIARSAADVNRRADDRRRENPQRRFRRQFHAHASEIQRQGDCIARQEHCKFCRTADFHLSARVQGHHRLARMHRHYAAVRNIKAGPNRRRPAVRRRAVLARYVPAFDSPNRVRRRTLGARGDRNGHEYTQQKANQLPARKSGDTSGAWHELEPKVHRVRLYYTAVNATSSSGAPATRATASGIAMPQLSRWRRMQIPVIAWAAYWLIRLLGPTLRVEIVGVHNAIQIRSEGEPGIGAFWHRCILSAVWIWRKRGIVVLNTVNFDGQWTRRVIERLGFGTAQGSSSRGAVEGLAAMAQSLEAGHHVAFTIDGPRGPRYIAKPGPVILARRTGRSISVFHVGVERAHTFKKSWDLFRVPLPFSGAVMFVAPPIYVPKDGDSEVMKQKQAEMQAALDRVRDDAESWFSLSEEQRDELRDKYNGRTKT